MSKFEKSESLFKTSIEDCWCTQNVSFNVFVNLNNCKNARVFYRDGLGHSVTFYEAKLMMFLS